MDEKHYLIVGYIGLERLYVESFPERNILHGTMGDYGYTKHRDQAKRMQFSTAAWHASRVYGFDGHRGATEEA